MAINLDALVSEIDSGQGDVKTDFLSSFDNLESEDNVTLENGGYGDIDSELDGPRETERQRDFGVPERPQRKEVVREKRSDTFSSSVSGSSESNSFDYSSGSWYSEIYNLLIKNIEILRLYNTTHYIASFILLIVLGILGKMMLGYLLYYFTRLYQLIPPSVSNIRDYIIGFALMVSLYRFFLITENKSSGLFKINQTLKALGFASTALYVLNYITLSNVFIICFAVFCASILLKSILFNEDEIGKIQNTVEKERKTLSDSSLIADNNTSESDDSNWNNGVVSMPTPDESISIDMGSILSEMNEEGDSKEDERLQRAEKMGQDILSNLQENNMAGALVGKNSKGIYLLEVDYEVEESMPL